MTEMSTLARFVQPELSERRLNLQWAHVRGRLAAPRRAGRWVALACATLVVAVLAFLITRRPTLSAPHDENVTRIETAADGTQATLADGSRLDIAPHSRLRVVRSAATRVELELESGGVECDVTRDPRRDFVVTAAGSSVRVVGTRFSVRFEDAPDARRLVVSVSRGAVEVAQGGGRVRLNAGDSLSRELGAAPPTSARPSAEPPVEATGSEPPPAAASASGPPGAAKSPETAKQLLERAARARAQGKSAAARAALMELRARYPNDARAPLAAFELARLDQDEGADPSASEKLLAEAIEKAPPGSALREDAEARRIEALSAKNPDACRAARREFLSRYPTSIHRARVLRACATP
jgi:hypothetical protein